MLKHARHKLLFLSALTLIALIAFLPSVTGTLPGQWGAFLSRNGVRLGLDLQGGVHLILKVDLTRVMTHQLEVSATDLKTAFRNEHVTAGSMEILAGKGLRIHLRDSADRAQVQKIIVDEFPNLSIAAPRTINGETVLELTLNETETRELQENAVAQSLEVIRNRIDQFGVTEPVIVRQRTDEIVVQLPGIKDAHRAIDLIGRTAQLEFKLVHPDTTADLGRLMEEATRSGRLHAHFTHAELNNALRGKIPSDSEIYMEKTARKDSGYSTKRPLLLKKETIMTGEALKTARMVIGGRYNEPEIDLSFNRRGALQFERITGENTNRQLAIVLDDVVQSAPVIRERIAGGKAQITGSFTLEEASDLAIALRAGALPAPVDIIQNLTVGPSLGLDSIHNGIASAVLGFFLVVVFMIVYYRFSGAIANLALILNLILLLGVLSVFNATLTLPGIAGIVLSIGMAVDSNVLIFERMREEQALQKPIWSAIDGGYHKALWTIIDSHVTTLITAFALFLFGTGPIKGFAVTLSIGVILNLFTALYGTKSIYEYLKVKRRLPAIRFLQFFRNPSIHFIRLRNIAFVFSGALVLLGLIAFVQIERGKANLGVDFTGGTMLQLKASIPFHLADIRSALNRNRISDYEIQEVPDDNLMIVRVKDNDFSNGRIADQILTVLSREITGTTFTLQSKAEIGASVSQALQRAALIAVAISLAGIVGYLAWRFDLRFGVAAAIATFHDVLAVLGIFYLLDKEITLLVITALLTLAGYSLTDTVVVFDRIRENLAKKRNPDLGETINLSINEVLSRTIITSGTVFMVLVALWTMGGILLRDFALALTIGVIVGTYSSIFVASPIVYIWPGKIQFRTQKSPTGRPRYA